MIVSEPRVKKRIFATSRNKASFWSRMMSFVTGTGVVAIGTIVALLIAQHLQSGSNIGEQASGWFNWIVGGISSVDPFITVAVIAVLGLVGLAFYARDH